MEPALAVWRAALVATSQPPGQGRTTAARSRLRSPTSLLLVAGDPVVGLLLVELVAERLEVTLLVVAPDHRRAGVAAALVAALLARFPAVSAWSTAPQVCEALGFTRTGRTRDGEVELATGFGRSS